MLWLLPSVAAIASEAPSGKVIQDCPECPPVVVIASGQFEMGARDGESLGGSAKAGAIEQGTPEILQPRSDAKPRHLVRFRRSFALGQREVTWQEFAAFVQSTHYQQDGKDCLLTDVSSDPSLIKQDVYANSQAVRNSDWRYPPWPNSSAGPVTCVNYEDATAYTAWLTAKTGHRYRLPSESEWEYSARAGTDGYWYWGNDASKACEFENVADRSFMQKRMRSTEQNSSFDCDDGYAWNAPVASFRPNPWGLYDTVGNVSELVEDCWHDSYIGAPEDGSAWTHDGDCRFRVLRGDNGMLNLQWTHLAARSGVPAQQYRSNLGGFRVARDL